MRAMALAKATEDGERGFFPTPRSAATMAAMVGRPEQVENMRQEAAPDLQLKRSRRSR